MKLRLMAVVATICHLFTMMLPRAGPSACKPGSLHPAARRPLRQDASDEGELEGTVLLSRHAAGAAEAVVHDGELELVGNSRGARHVDPRRGLAEAPDRAVDHRAPRIEHDLAGLQHAAHAAGRR